MAEVLSVPSDLPLWETGLPVLTDLLPLKEADLAPPTHGGPQRWGALEPDDPSAAREALRRAWEETLARGQAEADRVVDQARQEASAIRERARREGLQEFVEAEVEAFREVMAEVARELSQEFLVRWKGLELEAARLCVDLAANVVRKVVAEDDGVVVETVREGLARIPAARAVTIRVSPDCQAAVAAAAPALAQELLYGVALEVVADDTVAAGGALLQSSNGEVDLLLETQIARLREAAAAAIERELAQDEGGVARARTPTGGDDSHAAPADSLANEDYLDTEVHR